MQRSIALVSVLLALTGCQAIKDKLARRDKDADPSTLASSGVGGASGAPTGVMIVPDAWPAFLPLYPKAKLLGSAGDSQQKTVLEEVAASPEDITAFYADKLESAGYAEKRLTFYGPSATLAMRKDVGLVTVTVVGGNDNKQTVTVTVVTSAPRPNLDAGIWRAAAASAKAKAGATATSKATAMPAVPAPTF